MIKYDYFGATEQGRRSRNEDSFIVFKNKFNILIAGLTDGMGGHKGGHIASKSIIMLLKKEFKEVNFGVMTDESIEKKLLTGIRNFQKELKRVGDEFPDLSDMGSTLNLNLFIRDKVYTINVGDSRTSLFIKKGIVKISEDHNLATLAKKNPKYAHFTKQTNMLTSSLGPNKNTVADSFITLLESKSGYVLMTTDGVHNFISEISLIKIIKASTKSLEEKVNEIIKTAYNNGSNDNMTLLLFKYEQK